VKGKIHIRAQYDLELLKLKRKIKNSRRNLL
jgi:hypothetical protein